MKPTQINVDRGLNKNDIINLLKIANTGLLEHLLRRVQSRMDALAWVENEVKIRKLLEQSE